MNILIGSCGGLTGQYLIKQFKKLPERPKVFGFDVNYYCYARTICDTFSLVPSVSQSEEFLVSLVEIINSNNIQLYIPTLSMECALVSENEDFLNENTECFFVVSPMSTFRSLEDKLVCYKNLSDIGVDVPAVYHTQEDIKEFPVFIKPRVGSGGKGTYVANSVGKIRQEFDAIVVMEYLER